MLKGYISLTALLLVSTFCFAQLTGNKTIPGTYATIAAAIADVNTQGVGAGGVTFNLAAGCNEIAPAGGIVLTATGTVSNPINFQKSGMGTNPKITSTDAGTVATSVFGGQGDAIIIIQGSDYVTFDGIDVTATQSGIEYGYYIRKASGTDGCKNITITNAAITMTKGTSAYVTGVYASNNSNASAASSAAGITITSTDGINENVSLTGNTISNVFTGIAVMGYDAPSPYNLYDQNFTIGTSEQGNTIQNFAGNTTATSYGIYTLYVKSASISYNTIANAANGGTGANGTLSGIYFDTNASSSGTYVANDNIITLSQLSAAAVNFIYNGSTVTLFTANSNSFGAASFASTATSYLIYNSNTTTTTTIINNQTTGTITKTGAGAFYGYYNYGSGTAATSATYSGNNFSNISLASNTDFVGINLLTVHGQLFTMVNNTISNITGNGASTMYGIKVTYGANIASTIDSSIYIYNNIISNLTGAKTIYGIECISSNKANIYKNKIYRLITSNGGFVCAMNVGSKYMPLFVYIGQSVRVYNNLIGDLNAPQADSTSEAVIGINLQFVVSSYTNYYVYYNTVYINAVSTGANFSSSAFRFPFRPVVIPLPFFRDHTTLTNNIFVNTSTANGTGHTSVLTYPNSINFPEFTANNNLYFAGLPAPNAVIYHAGSTNYQTLAEFQQLSSGFAVTEFPPFASTTGSSANYLHITSGATTQANNGGKPISGITDDYDGDIRNALTPDIGADEFEGVLPITFEYLKGQKAGSSNALNWKVACTSTSITMVLERSNDGHSFGAPIARITASQARCGQPFDATDAAPLNGTNYYRLKMIDVDGTVSYSPVVAVLNGRAGAELIGIYPTLVHDAASLSVTASRSAKMQIHISDMSGKVIQTTTQTVANGSTLLNINTSNLATGVYNISGMLDGVRTQTLHFIKQ